MGFDGLRVIAFESRRATEIAELIRRNGGEPFVAPAVRELPLERNDEAFSFAERLFHGEFDMMILLTGVGTRSLADALATRWPRERFAEALRSTTVVARGPKPAAALRELDVPVTVSVPEPNTWRELLKATENRPERRIAVQEYGRSNTELLNALRDRGASVTPVRVYRWDLPEDTAPLHEAVRRICSDQADAVMFTTSVQVEHLFRVTGEQNAEKQIQSALQRMMIASIGPTTTEALLEYDIHPDLTPSHPKMGILVKEAGEQAKSIIGRKRGVNA